MTSDDEQSSTTAGIEPPEPAATTERAEELTSHAPATESPDAPGDAPADDEPVAEQPVLDEPVEPMVEPGGGAVEPVAVDPVAAEPVAAEPVVDESIEPVADERTEDSGDDDAAPRRNTLVGLALLAVVLVGILVAVLLTGGGDDAPPVSESAPTTEARPPGPTLPEAAFKVFHDDATKFSVRYPSSWQLSQAPVSEIRFVATPGPGQGEAISVRVNETEQVTTAENLANVKSVTDGTIASNPTARILKTDAITLNGLIGYYYLYTFKDSASGLEGVHAHYFLFKGNKMYSMVFQVLPAEKFAEFAGVFDQIADSFKVDP
ncbi:MAG TPA: PsbP-related protein [Acidimicrobiales bacterium]|nr:PsbP-related protein [Acidimicrobiales bacterium]